MSGPYRFIIFDWDGTLMDSGAMIVACFQHAAQAAGLTVPEPHAIRQLIGLSVPEVLQILYPDVNDKALFETLQREYVAHQRSLPHSTVALYPGVKETLQDLQEAGLLMAIATGLGRAGLDRALEEVAIGHYFAATRCGDEAFSKPHPQMVLDLFDIVGAQPQESLMVGDTSYDMQMAKNVGMDCIGVSYGVHDKATLAPHEPIAIIDEMNQLKSHVGVG